MKKFLLLVLISGNLCAVIFTSCNRSNQIPPGSIYQSGDVVYKIDKITMNDGSLNTHSDLEFIYRKANSKIIYFDHANNRRDIRDMYISKYINDKEFKIEGADEAFSITISNKSIGYYMNENLIEDYLISQIIKY